MPASSTRLLQLPAMLGRRGAGGVDTQENDRQ